MCYACKRTTEVIDRLEEVGVENEDLKERVTKMEGALSDYLDAWPTDIPAADGPKFIRAQATMDALGLARLLTPADEDDEEGEAETSASPSESAGQTP